MELPKRKSPRLKSYDYAASGAYFVTICTHEKKALLSHIIVGRALAPAENILKQFGQISEKNLGLIEERYSFVKIEYSIIMPNHIHLLLRIRENTASTSTATISDVIRTYKSLTARECKTQCGIAPLFQTSFHDHIIRDEKDYTRIAEYILNNPAKWQTDCFFTD